LSSGPGGQPTTTFDALVAWVENGTVPETLPVSFAHNGTTFDRILCPYPLMAVYDGVGDKTAASSFTCA
jgi:feruloyl esterase